MDPIPMLLLARFTLAVGRRPGLLTAEPWYHREGTMIRALARECALPAHRAIDAAAVLSPAVQWQALTARLPRFFRAAATGAPRPSMPGYGPNVRKAWAILRGETVYAHGPGRIRPAEPSGPKVTRFARNLAGDPDVVTVDRWAARAAGMPESGGAPWYRALEAGYHEAARAAGETPAQFQAVLWVACREHVIAWGPLQSANMLGR